MANYIPRKCVNCGDTKHISRVDEYRYNVEFDKNLLGCNEVLGCSACGLYFADPMPSLEALNNYYGKVFRAEGRPHWKNSKAPPYPTEKHYSYLATISQSVDVENLHAVFEVGPGAGELGMLMKAAIPSIELYCAEPDRHNYDLRCGRGYQDISSPSDMAAKVDLVMSVHSLEHFSSIDAFFNIVETVIAPGGVVFLEVPNCPFGGGYENRGYDSPHLLFFTKDSIRSMFERRGYELNALTTVGLSFEEGFQGEEIWKRRFSKWTPSAPFSNSKAILRRRLTELLPSRVFSVLGRTRNALSYRPENSLRSACVSNFVHNKSSSWNVRAVATRRGRV